MARDVSHAVRIRVSAWAKATESTPDDVMGRLLDGPVHDYDGVDDFFRDMARTAPEAAVVASCWERTHGRTPAVEADAEAFCEAREDASRVKRRDVRRAGDVWVVRVSPEEEAAFLEAMARSPYVGNRSAFLRAGMATLCREIAGRASP